MLTHFGLFEGIGGFSYGARMAGIETVGWSEIDPFCQVVLKHHFPNAKGYGDIETTDFRPWNGKVEILTGGFPCQPFSTAGKRLGTEDSRFLWPQMLRAIAEIAPTFIVGENVRGIINQNAGMVFERCCTDLENIGYEVVPLVIPACGINAPHRRDRVWFVAYSEKIRLERQGAAGITGKPEKQAIRPNEGIGQNGHVNADTDKIRQSLGFCFGIPNEQEQPSWFPSKVVDGKPWGDFPIESPICGRNDGIPAGLDRFSVSASKWGEWAIGAFGNAIVPQLAYLIFKALLESAETPCQ